MFQPTTVDEGMFGSPSRMDSRQQQMVREADRQIEFNQMAEYSHRSKFQREVVENEMFARDSQMKMEEQERMAKVFGAGDQVMANLRLSPPATPEDYDREFERLQLHNPDALRHPDVANVFNRQLERNEETRREAALKRAELTQQSARQLQEAKMAAFQASQDDPGLRAFYNQRKQEIMAEVDEFGTPINDEADAAVIAANEVKGMRESQSYLSAISSTFGLDDDEIYVLMAQQAIADNRRLPEAQRMPEAELIEAVLGDPPLIDAELNRRLMIAAMRKTGMIPDGQGGVERPKPPNPPDPGRAIDAITKAAQAKEEIDQGGLPEEQKKKWNDAIDAHVAEVLNENKDVFTEVGKGIPGGTGNPVNDDLAAGIPMSE